MKNIRGIIYCYTFPDGKKYIGQTTNEKDRRRTFLKSPFYTSNQNPNGTFNITEIDNYRFKYGVNKPTYEVLEELYCDDVDVLKEKLDLLEIEYIKHYDTFYNGLNETEGGTKTDYIRAKAKTGKSIGAWGVGYKPDEEGNMKIDPIVAPIIRKVFEMYASGEHSLNTIAQELIDCGDFKLMDRSENLQTAKMWVSNVLQKKALKGDFSDTLYRGLEPIVSPELWDKCNYILHNRNNLHIPKSKTKEISLCKGLIYTEDGYILSPHHNNNTYRFEVKGHSVSVNMKAVDKIILYYTAKYFNNQIELPLSPEDRYKFVRKAIKGVVVKNIKRVTYLTIEFVDGSLTNCRFTTNGGYFKFFVGDEEKEITKF